MNKKILGMVIGASIVIGVGVAIKLKKDRELLGIEDVEVYEESQ